MGLSTAPPRGDDRDVLAAPISENVGTGAAKVKVRFVGAEACVNRDVGAATGEGDHLVPGKEYEVPRELADALVGVPNEDGELEGGSSHWELVKPRSKGGAS